MGWGCAQHVVVRDLALSDTLGLREPPEEVQLGLHVDCSRLKCSIAGAGFMACESQEIQISVLIMETDYTK